MPEDTFYLFIYLLHGAAQHILSRTLLGVIYNVKKQCRCSFSFPFPLLLIIYASLSLRLLSKDWRTPNVSVVYRTHCVSQKFVWRLGKKERKEKKVCQADNSHRNKNEQMSLVSK